jgi:hypothetical protein
MNASGLSRWSSTPGPAAPSPRVLRNVVTGDVLTDAASCARYSTDASDLPGAAARRGWSRRATTNVRAAMDAVRAGERADHRARCRQLPQCGHDGGRGLVVDHSKHLTRIIAFDAAPAPSPSSPHRARPAERLAAQARAVVPGRRQHVGQCTLGGMAGNNSCGSRSIAYGNMVHNVARSTRARRRHRARFGPSARCRRATRVRELVAAARDRRARARRDRARVPKRDAPRRRLQHRRLHPQSERPYTPTAASTSRTCSSAAKARSRGRAR